MRPSHAQRGAVLQPSPYSPWARIGLFGLAVYGLLIGYGTLEPQRDQTTDPEGGAVFVSSTRYLLSHVPANVLGPVLAVLAVLGTVALGATLARGRSSQLGLWGMVLAVDAHALFSVPGVDLDVRHPADRSRLPARQPGRDAAGVIAGPVADRAAGLLLAVVGNVLLGAAWECRPRGRACRRSRSAGSCWPRPPSGWPSSSRPKYLTAVGARPLLTLLMLNGCPPQGLRRRMSANIQGCIHWGSDERSAQLGPLTWVGASIAALLLLLTFFTRVPVVWVFFVCGVTSVTALCALITGRHS